jgi:hypothetical protein
MAAVSVLAVRWTASIDPARRAGLARALAALRAEARPWQDAGDLAERYAGDRPR